MMRLTSQRPFLTFLKITLMALLLCSGSHLFAQATNAGTITGTVTDPQGAVIPGAVIVLTDQASKDKRTTVANGTGNYVLPEIPSGTYDLTASKPGFSTDQILGLTVSVGTQTTANFKMTVGAENTTVEVTASNADLQTLNATTGTTVDTKIVESLPAIGRDAATFLSFQPGVTPGGNVAGTTLDQTMFQLDGGNSSSDMDGTQAGYTSNNVNSTTGGFLSGGANGVVPTPQDSIEEFKVATSGQTADFNNSSGGQAQIVTKRGHDQVHGTVYEYYLDNNFNGNTWQNNFPTAYTAKPSYHYSRFGAAAGGPIAPFFLGGKTYLFGNYEGFRYPLAATFERTIPSYEFLQQGQLTFGATTYSPTQLTTADPRGIGFNPTLKTFYNTQLPVAPVGDNGASTAYAGGTFDKSCGALSGAVCDSVNIIGYKANIRTPQSSNFVALRLDHDFGQKWHLMLSYRYYKLTNLTSNQVDFGGGFAGDKVGIPVALANRPQVPSYYVLGLTTNISSSLTNDFHFSYTHNFWQWKDNLSGPQITGASGAIEPLGESSTIVLSPYNVNAQNVRTRIWNGKDNYLRDDLTKLKGDHLIQFGGLFQHNFNYHQRTDNGASINYTPTYQIGGDTSGGNIAYSSTGIGGAATTGAYRRLADTYYGFVTATQVANTYANNKGTLNLNSPYTPIAANTSIPYYNLYVTDTWKVTRSLTVNYGLSYAIEMPPTERNGNQVMTTDTAGNAIKVQDYLNSRAAAAANGQVYEPEIGFALVHNVIGGRKYTYDPFYGAVSPRVSAAWNPKFKSEGLNKLFGNGATVIRGGYGRLYGRLNGDVQVLNPLLSPGLILATQCKYAQNSSLGTGNCTQSNFTESTAYRFGPDGTAPTLAGAALPTTLAQPYHPGYDGPGVSIASPDDPTLRPNDVDTFNLSLQRQIGRKMLLEVGYIGRLIHHEYVYKNTNTVPYMMSLGGQTFEAAYIAVETGYQCTVAADLCSANTTNAVKNKIYPTVAPQPFFEAALGGAGSAYCTGYTNCTAAVVAKQASNFGSQSVFSLWQALDNNVNGAGGAGWVFGRSLMGTTTSNATYGGAGQIVTGESIAAADGYGNYNGGYVSFKANGFHGLTLQENLTYSKALGLGSFNQYTSSITAEDSFNLGQQYGIQPFNQKYIFNTFAVYQPSWYKDQRGVVGRLLGGWTFAPVFTAGTGQPLICTSNNSGQNFGGEDGSTFTDNESCVFTTPYSGARTHRGIPGSSEIVNNQTISVGTNTKLNGSPAAEVNFFGSPLSIYRTVRPVILGLDNRDSGTGPITGLGYINLDLSVRKNVKVFEKASLEFSGTMTNVMNHMEFSNPSLSLQSVTNWGTTKTQGNAPRTIQMGVRASF